MKAEQAQQLRAPFPATQVGKLPKLTCKACSESRTKNCEKHSKSKCGECGNYISSAHLHLDYVGHAATTDRLLQVDPAWTWEPAAVGPNGEPLITNGGLWIRLTVAGVTRYGFGDGGSPKEIIGDAIRNAAMRFGVALDLWAKEDLHAGESQQQPELSASDNGDGTVGGPAPWTENPEQVARARELLQGSGGEPQADHAPSAVAADEGAVDGTVSQADSWPTEPASPPDEPLASAAQRKKLDVLYGTLERAGALTKAQLIRAAGGEGESWSVVRDQLSKEKASELIERLSRYEETVAS